MSTTSELNSGMDLREVVISLLAGDEDAAAVNVRAADMAYRAELRGVAEELARAAFTRGDRAALHTAHWVLGDIYDRCFSLPPIEQVDSLLGELLDDIRSVLENAMLADLSGRMDHSALACVPRDPESFLPWYRNFISSHTASNHPFYRDFLEKRASAEDLRFYLAQETSLDPRFDDILSFLTVGTNGAEKMELVQNLWDEMGNGNPAEVHTTVFAKTLADAGVSKEFIDSNIMLESLVCGNVSAALALSRRHCYKAFGYFGVTEYLTPRRFRSYIVGCRRLGMPGSAYVYHEQHIQIDARHGPAWFKNILLPAIAREPRCAAQIALGTVMRLETSTWYLDALQTRLELAG
ncbi:iron-containing redox enzyme family protein [Streptomyces antioxidans]|uniref:iron-containing redox enzyme family protein n=1 Tax=Streptomyces antioxidans TaxID=1507734 RepID=UPI001301E45C|nr:iron-containing redox enzyme family protein [Streptomyces antioxidans]